MGSSEGESSNAGDLEWASRRSSLSSGEWNAYDSEYGFQANGDEGGGFVNPSGLTGFFESPSEFEPFASEGEGQAEYPDDERNIATARSSLERAAASVRDAMTSTGQDRARGAFVQTW